MNSRDLLIAALVGGAALYVTMRLANASTGGQSPLAIFNTPNGAIVTPGASSTSPQGVLALKSREGLRLTAYPDAQGYSIGYGHYIVPGDGLSQNSTISTTLADALFTNDLANVDSAMRRLITQPLTQNEWDALASLIYNIGVNAFAASTLLGLLNAGAISQAAQQFMAWNKSGNSISPALNNRRAAEMAEFLATGTQYA